MLARSVASAVVLTLALGFVPPARTAPGASGVESSLLSLINGGRSRGALRIHAGLRTVAREHSAAMARRRSLGHQGFDSRLRRAAPSPSEPNGAPDDGFSSQGYAACENVGRYKGPGDPASAVYRGWVRSSSHNRCMFDKAGRGYTAAGVGVFLDRSGQWWATLEAVKDATPPR